MIGQPKKSEGYKQTRRALRYEEANGTIIIDSAEDTMRRVRLVDSLHATQQNVEPTITPTKEVTMEDDTVSVDVALEPETGSEQPQNQPSKLTQVNVVLCAIRVLLSADQGQFAGSAEALASAVKGDVELTTTTIKACIAQLRKHEFVWLGGTRRNPVYHVDMDATREVTASMIGEPEPQQDAEPAAEAETVISTPTTEEIPMPEELTSSDVDYVSVKTETPATQADKPKTLLEEVLNVAKRVDEENERLRRDNENLGDEVGRLKAELREAKTRLASYETPTPEVQEFLKAHAVTIS
jgi:hypothetical protein